MLASPSWFTGFESLNGPAEGVGGNASTGAALRVNTPVALV